MCAFATPANARIANKIVNRVIINDNANSANADEFLGPEEQGGAVLRFTKERGNSPPDLPQPWAQPTRRNSNLIVIPRGHHFIK